MHYIIFDLEWNSGYSYAVRSFMNEIIEIGAVKLDEKLNIVDTFKLMITPVFTKKLSARCKRLTGITNEELKQNGVEFNKAFAEFASWSSGKNNVFMSWSNSDLYVLSGNFLQHNGNCHVDFMHRYCDVQKYCMSFVERDEEHKNNQIALGKCAEIFGIDVDVEKLHRALADCYVTAECFSHVYDREKLDKYIKSCDASFFERLLYKPFPITETDSPYFKVGEMDLFCPYCKKPMKNNGEYTLQNQSFKGTARCAHCQKSFWVFIHAKKCYDGISVKEHYVEMNKKRARKLNKTSE